MINIKHHDGGEGPVPEGGTEGEEDGDLGGPWGGGARPLMMPFIRPLIREGAVPEGGAEEEEAGDLGVAEESMINRKHN